MVASVEADVGALVVDAVVASVEAAVGVLVEATFIFTVKDESNIKKCKSYVLLTYTSYSRCISCNCECPTACIIIALSVKSSCMVISQQLLHALQHRYEIWTFRPVCSWTD